MEVFCIQEPEKIELKLKFRDHAWKIQESYRENAKVLSLPKLVNFCGVFLLFSGSALLLQYIAIFFLMKFFICLVCVLSSRDGSHRDNFGESIETLSTVESQSRVSF